MNHCRLTAVFSFIEYLCLFGSCFHSMCSLSGFGRSSAVSWIFFVFSIGFYHFFSQYILLSTFLIHTLHFTSFSLLLCFQRNSSFGRARRTQWKTSFQQFNTHNLSRFYFSQKHRPTTIAKMNKSKFSSISWTRHRGRVSSSKKFTS